eukprot:TRINITY_DN33507_c0_g1_i1.p1 TRINITY_DN33507_c0_g1~~TRINITY_DN33507_c0_g1_i1.p1  ORF type:complete len:1061 (+),score=231.77 TRINITY_DN33507_c0_g1_i1:53-3184(+)
MGENDAAREANGGTTPMTNSSDAENSLHPRLVMESIIAEDAAKVGASSESVGQDEVLDLRAGSPSLVSNIDIENDVDGRVIDDDDSGGAIEAVKSHRSIVSDLEEEDNNQSDVYLLQALRAEFVTSGRRQEVAGVDAAGDDQDGDMSMKQTKSLTRGVSSKSIAADIPTIWTQQGLEVKSEEAIDTRPAWRQTCGRVVELKSWTATFMILTIYALFAPDLDMIVGHKQSKENMRVSTSVVAVFFLVEIVVQSLGKKGYLLRAYFWLDFVSFASILPETYLVALAYDSNSFVAGRSSRLTRMVRVVTRSSRAARLNRLGRMVRIAALMPRLQRLWGRRVEEKETERMLEKKLYRVFCFLDADMDSFISKEDLARCIDLLTTLAENQKQKSKWGQITRIASNRFKSQIDTSLRNAVNTQWTVNVDAPAGNASTSIVSKTETGSSAGAVYAVEQVTYQDFQTEIMKDEILGKWLRTRVEKQLKYGENISAMRQQNAEYIGVKIALAILFIIFILGFVEILSQDNSLDWGFKTCDSVAKLRPPVTGVDIPIGVQRQVEQWVKGNDDWGRRSYKLLYLQLQKREFCNVISPGRQSCDLPNSTAMVWSERTLLTDIDKDLRAGSYRSPEDLLLLRHPDYSEEDISEEELERKTESVAVLVGREETEATSRDSILTTCVVIVIILVGITMLTRDLTFLSKNLLKPLIELSDEMESIIRLQMAATERKTEENSHELGEIRLMQRSFDNMKKAIRSWGKYVPWPVVQLLMRKDAEASLEVTEKEVSIYFSDIASFTTIVESLHPEKSLMLLSRYFQDMSQIIDDHGGIVLEYIGDAIMSIHGAPVLNESHPTAAVQAAVRMQEALTGINAWCERKGLPKVAVRCGVHTGKVLVGNMGFQSRMKYGIVGEEADKPGKLEEMNKNYSTNMLISHQTFQRLDPAQFIIRTIDFVYLAESGPEKQSEPVYEVMPRYHTKSSLQRKAAILHNTAMDCYRDLEFEQAAGIFESVGQLMLTAKGEEDQPSSMMLKRCRSYMKRPPPNDWDGVWDRANEG